PAPQALAVVSLSRRAGGVSPLSPHSRGRPSRGSRPPLADTAHPGEPFSRRPRPSFSRQFRTHLTPRPGGTGPRVGGRDGRGPASTARPARQGAAHFFGGVSGRFDGPAWPAPAAHAVRPLPRSHEANQQE